MPDGLPSCPCRVLLSILEEGSQETKNTQLIIELANQVQLHTWLRLTCIFASLKWVPTNTNDRRTFYRDHHIVRLHWDGAIVGDFDTTKEM
jgi:hypothetical protein